MLPDTASASQDPQAPQAPPVSLPTTDAVVNEEPAPPLPGKKTTRQWDAWTREEEESFFIALRQVGKNFEKITSRVQSKNKDQVRHYYYRLIKRMNKLLGPGFMLDAKNSKDANSAMLRWWSLLEKHSCSASKLHLKPRRFKTFVTALEHQLLKDRIKANKKQAPRGDPVVSGPVIAGPVSGKSTASSSESAKNVTVGELRLQKAASGRCNPAKRKTEPRAIRSKGESSRPPRQRKKASDNNISAAAYRKWEKAASAGVNLVAEAAEQLERAAAVQHMEQAGPGWKNVKPCSTSAAGIHSEMDAGTLPASLATRDSQLVSDFRAFSEGNHTGAVVETGNQAAKLKLQLFPIDDFTRKSLEQDGLNPYLELTLKPRKAISSVLQHLAQKWGRSSAAAGHLQLFPFSTQLKNLPASQSWSFNDVSISAGDVYAVLGNPSVFRLRYGWLSSRMLQSSNAELQEMPCPSSSPTDGIEVGLQGGLQNNKVTHTIPPSVHMPPSSTNSSTYRLPHTDTENVLGSVSCKTACKTNAAICPCAGNIQQLESSAQTVCARCNTTSKISSNQPVNFHNHRIIGSGVRDETALAHPATGSGVLNGLVDKDARKLGMLRKTSLVSMECSNGIIQVEASMPVSLVGEGEANMPVSLVGEGQAGCASEPKVLPDRAGLKIQESARQLSSSSWIYGGSNDSFAQRLWAVEEQTNNGSLLPTEIDWVDSLTNISVGELLNEVSQAGHTSSGAQALQALQSLDSFDAAIATQGAYTCRVGSSLMHHTETPVWDGEDTRDAFAFQKVAAQKRAAVSVLDHSSCQEVLKESDGLAVSLSDFGSLEAWKQSFSHAEISYSEEQKPESGSQFLQLNPEGLVGKRCSSQEFYWADSFGSLDLGMPATENGRGQEPFFSGDMSLGGMVGSSLDVLQICSSQGAENKIPASTGCELQSSCNLSMVTANSICSTMTNASEHLQKELAMVRPGGMSTC